jgi:type I restriction-modification system DNA methylase subunit
VNAHTRGRAVNLELYSAQDAESKVILPTLRELGYDESDPHKTVVLRFQHPLTVHQGRERKTIYADVVVFVQDSPVIVVDSKNPRQYLTDNDREQVISYARLIGDVAPYAALCNGYTWQVFDSVSKQQIRGLPTYGELIRDLQRRRLTRRQRQNLVSQATRMLFAIESARDLSRLMRRCHDVIRNLKGYDPTKAFDELSKLLFAKMYEEREVAEGRRRQNRFTLAAVREMREQGVEIIQTLWRDTVTSDRYSEVFSDQHAEDGIELPPDAIDAIVAILEEKSLGLTDLDVKGIAFEEFLAATYRGGGLGQYFTPREVVNFMVDLVDPAIGERTVDPACGTGGFLIRVYDVVSDKIRSSELSQREKDGQLSHLANACLVGIDWEPRAARTCKMNMIIHGDGHAGVYQANSLDLQEVKEKVQDRQRVFPHAPAVEEGSFQIVLTNPPFGARDRTPRILRPYELGRGTSQKREVLLLERCIRLLEPGGRMAVVLPEGILSNKNDRQIRALIRRECIVKAVIRLPQDAFKMSDGAACTSILYAVKKDPNNPALREQGDMFYARAEYIGISPAGKPINRNDLLAIKEHYRRFQEDRWDGIEMRARGKGRMEILRAAPSDERGLWLEPEVNRTSLLYDRLSYVVRDPQITDRFSYTYDHPAYHHIVNALNALPVDVVTLQSLCVHHYPLRGHKPSEESAEGIPIIKVRNVTGRGISLDTEYAPDSQDMLEECTRALLRKDDILITSTGEGTIARVDVYPYEDTAIADGHITICRLRPNVNLRYVLEFLRSESGQIQMLRHVSGSTGQTELLVDHIRPLRIPMPSPHTQAEVVRLMDDARAHSEELLLRGQALRDESANVIASARQRMMHTLTK